MLGASATANVANTAANASASRRRLPPRSSASARASPTARSSRARSAGRRPSADSVSRVEFSIDGSTSWTETLSPYVFNGDGDQFDTTTIRNGKHVLSVKAFGTDGSTATANATVKFRN